MVRELRRNKTFWIGYAVLLLIGGILLVRYDRTVAAILNGEKPSAPGSMPTAFQSGIDLSKISYKDSLLVLAAPAARDPFQKPPVKSKPKRVVKQPKILDVPTLRALMYDTVNPSVQICIGTEKSGWLHVGQEFQGWTVVNITRESTRVSKGNRIFVMRAH